MPNADYEVSKQSFNEPQREMKQVPSKQDWGWGSQSIPLNFYTCWYTLYSFETAPIVCKSKLISSTSPKVSVSRVPHYAQHSQDASPQNSAKIFSLTVASA